MCDATCIILRRDHEAPPPPPRVHEVTYHPDDGHHRASADIVFYHDTLTDLVRWAKYPAKDEPLTQGHFSLNGGQTIEQMDLATVKHHNLMYKVESGCDTPAPHSHTRSCLHLLPGHHLFTKQRTVNNTVTYIDKRIHHIVRFFLKKDTEKGIGFMPTVYISRTKQERVAEKLQQVLFAKHKHVQTILLISDHHSGASAIGLLN